jgi:hypothetical protein
MYDVLNHQPDIEYVGVDPPFLPVISPAWYFSPPIANPGWWFGTFIFPFSWECHHPNWSEVHDFSEG